MKKRINRRRSRKRNIAFIPDHEYIENAVRDYLEKGGTITKIELNKESFKSFTSTGELPSLVDEFLLG